jgi:uncharacterized integral membrane protein (TIGR00698 family)
VRYQPPIKFAIEAHSAANDRKPGAGADSLAAVDLADSEQLPSRSLAQTLAPIAILVATAVGGLLAGGLVPAIGPAGAALIIGVVVAAARPSADSGSYASIATRVLQLAIVAIGLSVSATRVLSVAGQTLPLIVITVGIGLGVAVAIGIVLAVVSPLRLLIAAGSAICGASAIAATAPVVRASREDAGYAISVIFLFSLVAVISLPWIGSALGMSTGQFALWAGTAINDTSSVLAASTAFGAETVAIATVVKLARTLMILPVGLVLGAATARRTSSDLSLRASLRRSVPWVSVAFVGASLLNATGLIPAGVAALSADAGRLGSVIALGAIGLSTDVGRFRSRGIRPIACAGLTWLIVAGSSLYLQGVFHPSV